MNHGKVGEPYDYPDSIHSASRLHESIFLLTYIDKQTGCSYFSCKDLKFLAYIPHYRTISKDV